MTDISAFQFINGLAGHVRVIDEFFKGLSNDYTALIAACLILVWLWFATRNTSQRLNNQRAVLSAMLSLGIASILMLVINHFYFSPRPFNVLPADSINLLFINRTIHPSLLTWQRYSLLWQCPFLYAIKGGGDYSWDWPS